MQITDVGDSVQIFHLIQSIPSPKAEPFKIWLAQVAAKRLDEMHDLELYIDRALEQYLKLGYSEKWLNQSIKSCFSSKSKQTLGIKSTSTKTKISSAKKNL